MTIVLMDEFINTVCELMATLEFHWCKESRYLDTFLWIKQMDDRNACTKNIWCFLKDFFFENK